MNKKIFNLTFVAIAAIGLIVGSYIYKDMAKRPTVSESEVKSENTTNVINLSGKIKSENVADLGFETGGKIIELNYAVGDHVQKGAVIAKVDSSDLNAQHQAAQAQIQSAQAILEKYKQAVKADEYKLKSLKKSSSANSNDKKAQEALISADEATVDSQKSQILALQKTAQSLADNINKTIILAPFNGLITGQDAEIGEIAVSNTMNSMPIITIINDNSFEIDAYASQLDAKNISVGLAAKVILDNDGRQILDAKVTAIDPAATIVNGVSSYKVTLNFTDSNLRLASGDDANIEIALAK
jgi:RND family efflux transporter MFP subunit